MKIKALAFAAIVAAGLATSATANEVNNGTFDSNLGGWASALSSYNGGSQAASLNGFSIVPGSIAQIVSIATAGSYTFSFDYSSQNLIGATLSTFGDINGWLVGSGSGNFSTSLDLLAGDYLLTLTGKNALIDNVSIKSNAAQVPGPEAGAGIGALAMGGVAFWISRRRKAA